MALKLDGVRVLDISRVLAGPYCSMILADLGAEVIKVEPPGGDETRTWPPFYLNGESGNYLALNRNKKGMVLNLKHPEGKKVLFDLAEKSAVMIENFTPGVVKRLGIDYETIKKINPKIIYCSISGFGQTGPYRKKKVYDPIIQSLGGVISITGAKNGEPAKVGIPIGDLGGSMMAVTAILAALFARETHGVGDFIDISMLDSQVALLSIMVAEYFAEGKVLQRWGLEHPWRVPSKTFQTKNGYITVSATSGTMYPAFCKLLGLEHLIDNPKFKTNADRIRNCELIYPIIEEVMRTKTSEEWDNLFEKADLPSGIMYTLDQVFSDPHILERRMLEVVDHPTIGKLKMIGVPFKFASDGTKKMASPPMLGEHTDDILCSILGYTGEEITRMRNEKVVS